MRRTGPASLVFLSCVLLAAACAQGGRPPGRGGTDSSTPPRDGGGGLDSGLDAGTAGDAGFDAGHDSGPTIRLDSGGGDPDAGCTSAAECDDGLVCNGVERCEGGRCTSGTAVVCDDGIACTVDQCTEPSGDCEYVPDDTLCGSGESCTLTSGCMAGCAESPCRLVAPQCGCATGQGCYIDGSGGRSCTTAGTNAEGQPCSGLTSCTPGNLCININRAGGSTPVCAHFCNLDSDCGDGICLYTLDDGMGGSIPDVTLCTHPCNPVTQTGCRTGAYCDIFRETMGSMRYFTDCTAPPTGSGGQGSACTDVDDCGAGYTCLDPDGTTGTAPQQCLHWCNVDTLSGCSSGTSCVGFTTPLVVEGTEYGVCI